MDTLEKIIKIVQIDPEDRKPEDINLLVQLTKDVLFFKEYIEQGKIDIQRRCCQFMVYEQFPEGKIVFNIGTIGLKFYVILEGEVGVYIRKQKTNIEQTQQQQPSSQLAQSLSRKPKNGLQKITRMLKEKQFKLSEVSEVDEKQQNPSQQPPEQDNQPKIAQAVITEIVKKPNIKGKSEQQQKRTLLRQNTIQQQDIDPELFCVSTLKAGQQFGELALINDKPRLATILCKKPCKFAVIDKFNFQKILKEQEEIKMMKALKLYSSIPLFENFSLFLLKQIHWISFRVKYKKNEKVFLFNEDPEAMYIVNQGEFLLYLKFEQTKKTEQEEEEGENLKEEEFFTNKSALPFPKQKQITSSQLNSNFVQGTDIKIGLIMPYQLIGEEDVFEGCKRTYNVVCWSGEGELIRIKIKDFKQRILNDESAFKYLCRNVPLKRTQIAKQVELTKKTLLSNMKYIAQQRKGDSLQKQIQIGSIDNTKLFKEQLAVPLSQTIQPIFKTDNHNLLSNSIKSQQLSNNIIKTEDSEQHENNIQFSKVLKGTDNSSNLSNQLKTDFKINILEKIVKSESQEYPNIKLTTAPKPIEKPPRQHSESLIESQSSKLNNPKEYSLESQLHQLTEDTNEVSSIKKRRNISTLEDNTAIRIIQSNLPKDTHIKEILGSFSKNPKQPMISLNNKLKTSNSQNALKDYFKNIGDPLLNCFFKPTKEGQFETSDPTKKQQLFTGYFNISQDISRKKKKPKEQQQKSSILVNPSHSSELKPIPMITAPSIGLNNLNSFSSRENNQDDLFNNKDLIPEEFGNNYQTEQLPITQQSVGSHSHRVTSPVIRHDFGPMELLHMTKEELEGVENQKPDQIVSKVDQRTHKVRTCLNTLDLLKQQTQSNNPSNNFLLLSKSQASLFKYKSIAITCPLKQESQFTQNIFMKPNNNNSIISRPKTSIAVVGSSSQGTHNYQNISSLSQKHFKTAHDELLDHSNLPLGFDMTQSLVNLPAHQHNHQREYYLHKQNANTLLLGNNNTVGNSGTQDIEEEEESDRSKYSFQVKGLLLPIQQTGQGGQRRNTTTPQRYLNVNNQSAHRKNDNNSSSRSSVLQSAGTLKKNKQNGRYYNISNLSTPVMTTSSTIVGHANVGIKSTGIPAQDYHNLAGQIQTASNLMTQHDYDNSKSHLKTSSGYYQKQQESSYSRNSKIPKKIVFSNPSSKNLEKRETQTITTQTEEDHPQNDNNEIR